MSIMRDHAHAYKLDDGVLMYAPLLINGEIDDEWCEVDFSMIDEDDALYCHAIERALGAMQVVDITATIG